MIDELTAERIGWLCKDLEALVNLAWALWAARVEFEESLR